ncbi:GFA family protein [Hyphobacterium sp. HN65]|uniref:GFA family protein n=1 Tax=Hyphobacterium lacteum TaxID=3116575 RepID=A0ABU7LTF2_9PROT|nr:GFA family protein [Hyphobacterium sp. HN65]MEE2527208.1 GFA family protein [Hyphobacterium sp. HN65]
MATGGCQCGRVRFETSGEPRFIANCHCRDCRKATGAAFSTWVGFESNQITWKGEPDRFASSEGVQRGFCKTCGTPLTYQGEKWPDETHILIGVFDQPETYTPKGDVFTEDALPFSKPKGR